MAHRCRSGRFHRGWWWLPLALVLGAAQEAGAADAGAGAAAEVAALYRSGSFERAYRLAVPVDSGAMQTMAAKAAIARGLYQGTSGEDTLTWLRNGEKAAQEAVKLTPDRPAALLALAQAKGEIARRTGPLANVSVPGDIGGLLKKAVQLAPDDPDALVGLGLWNLELTDRGVGWLYGAERDGALEMVARGVRLAPKRVDLRVQYAGALRIVGDVQQAREQLDRALALPADTALERYEQQRAKTMLGELGGASG